MQRGLSYEIAPTFSRPSLDGYHGPLRSGCNTRIHSNNGNIAGVNTTCGATCCDGNCNCCDFFRAFGLFRQLELHPLVSSHDVARGSSAISSRSLLSGVQKPWRVATQNIASCCRHYSCRIDHTDPLRHSRLAQQWMRRLLR